MVLLATYFEAIAWLGTFILLLRGIPQAYRCWNQGHSNGLSPSMLWLWLSGSLCMIPNGISHMDGPVIVVYSTNVLFVGIMLWYKYFPRRADAETG